MRSFMSKTLSGGAERSTSVRAAGQENQQPQPLMPSKPQVEVNDPQNVAEPAPIIEEKTTVVLKGPLGEVMTKALQMSYKKPSIVTDIAGVESITSYVQANGMVHTDLEEADTVHAVREVVGVIPATSVEATCLNALLEGARSVRDIEFIFVGSQMDGPSASSKSPSAEFIPGIDGNPAIESMHVVIKYKKR
jgi:hypothetical protein